MNTKKKTKEEKLLAALKKCSKNGVSTEKICSICNTKWPTDFIRRLRMKGYTIETIKKKDGTFIYKLIG